MRPPTSILSCGFCAALARKRKGGPGEKCDLCVGKSLGKSWARNGEKWWKLEDCKCKGNEMNPLESQRLGWAAKVVLVCGSL